MEGSWAIAIGLGASVLAGLVTTSVTGGVIVSAAAFIVEAVTGVANERYAQPGFFVATCGSIWFRAKPYLYGLLMLGWLLAPRRIGGFARTGGLAGAFLGVNVILGALRAPIDLVLTSLHLLAFLSGA